MRAVTKLAERITTAVTESVHRLPGEGIYSRGLEELEAQRHLPRRANMRLLDVEIPAQPLKSGAAHAGDEPEQVANRQE